MSRRLYRGLRLLDPASGLDMTGDVLVDGTVVADFGPRVIEGPLPDDITVIDGNGLWLLPGLVDIRAFLPGGNNRGRESLHSASQAAAAGGITTLVCTADGDPVIDSVPVLDAIMRRGREIGLTTVLCYGALTRGLNGQDMTEMGLLHAAGAVGFMDGIMPVQCAAVMYNAMRYAKLFNSLILSHPEEKSLTREGVAHAGKVAARLGLKGMPACAESIIVARDLELAAVSGARLHLCHLSSASSVAMVRSAKASGLPVTCDVSAFHLLLNDTAVMGYNTAAKLNPPLRSEEDRQALLAGLADGTIDAVASDHTPYSLDDKRVPFASAAFGAVGLETLLSAVVQAGGRKLSPLTLLKAVTAGPACILGLQAGQLKKTHPADLVLYDPAREWTVEPDSFRSKSHTTPFAGATFKGRVVMTLKGGKTVFKLGE
jgi:dihydroorotase